MNWTRLEQHYPGGGGKFWEVGIDVVALTVRTKWGKLADPGLLSDPKQFATIADAQKHVTKLIRTKLNSGYQ